MSRQEFRQESSQKSRPKPLSGYKVVDFTAVYSGPICTRYLADCGAEVIKIEPPGIGDLVRSATGMTPAFAHFNAGKRSLAMDLKKEQGQQVARDLVSRADLVVENFRPGIMAQFGLDYASVVKENPELVYCSISGFGQSGPWVDRAAYAPIVHAASGFDAVFAAGQDSGDKRPPNWEIMVADMLTGAYAFGAIQTALLGRERHGGGEYLDVSMMDAMMTLIPAQLQAAQMEEPLAVGCFYPVKTSDGFVMVTVISNKNLENLCNLLGRPELLDDPRFVFGPRTQHFRELAAEIEKWSRQLSTEDCVDALNAASVPCSNYAEVKDLFTHPQTLERESFASIDLEQFGQFLIQTLPVRFQLMNNKPAPWVADLGQHSDEILCDELGLGSKQVEALRRSKVIA